MKQSNFWLRTLNVRSDEGWLVKKLFLFQFFQGAGIAFFFTAAFALFLARFPITELPYVFIISSLFQWIAGFIYSRIEHKFNINKLAIIVTVFMVVSMLIFRFSFAFINTGYFLYCMLAWFNVLYLLNNLEFWGVASLLFDARQSKRLFGVISAGDIPAKFIGYTLALLIVEYIGTINLLWVGMICMLSSIPFLLSINKAGVSHEVHPPKKHSIKNTAADVSRIVQNFAGNTLIRRLAALGIIITGSFIIINFAFYAGVKEAYHDDVSLAKFIAFFLAIVRIIALVIKMIFTSRLINQLGIIKSLLITPLVMLALIAAIILSQDMTGYQKFIIYLFGATSIVVDILRSAINSPVFLTIMQPLSNHERLRAHTIVKGIMDPFASLIAGLLLLVMIHYEEKVELLTLSYILLVIGILWIIGIYRVNSQYLQTIIKTISSRYFNNENFSINDSGTLEWLKEKTKTGNETEILNILGMLDNSKNEMSEDLLIRILQNPSPKVKLTALKMMQQKKIASVETFLVPLIQQENPTFIVAEAIRILCSNGVDNQLILPYLDHKDAEVRKAAMAGLFIYGSGNSKEKATSDLNQLILSGEEADRLTAAEILGSLEPGSDENNVQAEMILALMNDKDIRVRRSAFYAAGKSGKHILLQELMNRFDSDENGIMQPLFVAGENSFPFIETFINSKNATVFQVEKLILLCGRIGGEPAHRMLMNLLINRPDEYVTVIKALYRSNFNPGPADLQIFKLIINKLLTRCAGIIYMQSSLEPLKEKYQLLINSFSLELTALRETLLYIFALMYDRENINKVRTAYATGKKESIINAMEIIDITVRKEFAVHFNIIFEPGNISERLHSLRKVYPLEFFENVERVLVRILGEETRPYSNWTMACSLYTSKKQQHRIDNSIISKYTKAENILVRETALYAL